MMKYVYFKTHLKHILKILPTIFHLPLFKSFLLSKLSSIHLYLINTSESEKRAKARMSVTCFLLRVGVLWGRHQKVAHVEGKSTGEQGERRSEITSKKLW